MGTNFHTAPSGTAYTAAAWEAILAGLDRIATYHHNVMVFCDGVITTNKSTGQITWSDTIRINFNTTAGKAVQNTIAAGNVTLTDNQFAYVDLNETDGTALTASAATLSTDSASNFITYNRLVLAFRDASSDHIWPVHLPAGVISDPDKNTFTLTCADNVTVNWSYGSTQYIVLDRATTTFAFTGAYNGQRCVLVCEQDGTGSREVAFGAEVRAGTDLSSPPTLTTTAEKLDYLGYIYNGTDSKYDFVSMVMGF